MTKRFLFILICFLAFSVSDSLAAGSHTMDDGGMNNCNVTDKNSNTPGNCTDYLNNLDGSECLWQLWGLSDGTDMAPYYSSSTVTAEKSTAVYRGLWAYQTRDSNGVSGECRSAFPSPNMRLYLKRRASYDNDGTYSYLVGYDYCVARYLILGTDGWGYCWWHNDDNGNPKSNEWGDHYEATFQDSDVVSVGSTSTDKVKTLVGAAYGYHVCLQQINNNGTDLYPHTNLPNSSGHNQVCAYIVYPTGGCSNYFPSAAGAFIGCVDKPNEPGPDVFNTVIPADLSPRVDTSRCLTRGNDNVDPNCNRNKKSLIELGSTFDKPLLVLTSGKQLNAVGANQAPPVELNLTYQFYNADYDQKIKSCGSMNVEGFANKTYCAQVPIDNPGKVCACEKDPNFNFPTDPNDATPINFCGPNPIIGCSDRPTLEHSGLTIATTYQTYKDAVGALHPAAQINFVAAMKGSPSKPHYFDKKKRDACLNLADGNFYICGNPRVLAELPVTLRKRLPVPVVDKDGNGRNKEFLMEYYPNTVIKEPYPNLNNYKKGDAYCQDKNDKDVYYGVDGYFYKLDNNGKITSNSADGKVVCKYKGQKYNTNDGSANPQGYLRDTKSFYGINFKSMIPKLNVNGDIDIGRYTSSSDQPPALMPCTPALTTTLCNPSGKTVFVPGGDRNTDFCPKVPDQSNDNTPPANDPKCKPMAKGRSDANALTLMCPGVIKKVTARNGYKMCLEASAGEWPYKTILGYNNFIRGVYPNFQQTCNNALSTDYCATAGGAETVPEITQATQATGWATWALGLANTTDTGTCAANLGYTQRIAVSVYDTPQTAICSKAPAVTGASCTQRYNAFLQAKAQVNTKLINAQEASWINPGKNLTSAQIGAIMSPSLTQYIVGNLAWYVVPQPPTRVIDKFGNYTISNPCVLK